MNIWPENPCYGKVNTSALCFYSSLNSSGQPPIIFKLNLINHFIYETRSSSSLQRYPEMLRQRNFHIYWGDIITFLSRYFKTLEVRCYTKRWFLTVQYQWLGWAPNHGNFTSQVLAQLNSRCLLLVCCLWFSQLQIVHLTKNKLFCWFVRPGSISENLCSFSQWWQAVLAAACIWSVNRKLSTNPINTKNKN